MAERYRIATCPNMLWSKRESQINAWRGTELGKTATAMGLEPFEQMVKTPPPMAPYDFTFMPTKEICLMVTDEEYMLLKMKHSKWHECWKVGDARN